MSEPITKARSVKRIEIESDGWLKYGLLRCDQIIAPGGILPLSKSQFWLLVKERTIPAVKLCPRVTAFWVHDLRRAFFANTDTTSVGAPATEASDNNTLREKSGA